MSSQFERLVAKREVSRFLQRASSMGMPGLSYRKALAGIGWAISSSFVQMGFKNSPLNF